MDWKKQLNKIEAEVTAEQIIQTTTLRINKFCDELDTLTAMGIKMRQEAETINRGLEAFNEIRRYTE